MEKIRSRNKRNGEGRERKEKNKKMKKKTKRRRWRWWRWWCRWWYSGLGERSEEERNSARRSSAAITGCQLAKKSNARFPSLCDAMLMACRCLFSTRCLHTWLDPRGISEMFLAPIRNHIQLLSPLSNPVRSASLFLSPVPHVHDRLSLTPTTSPITFPCFRLFSFERKYTYSEE